MAIRISLIVIGIVGLALTSLGQDVNLFNGSLNYGANLTSVPSSAGNAVPVNISYGGNGIAVGQPASEVGLGWGMSGGGSIYRSIGGIPDDFDGNMFNQATKQFSQQKGVLFGATGFDILTSTHNLDSLEFYYPNYDSYSFSGPGMGGSLSPQILNYMTFIRNNNTGEYNYESSQSSALKKPQFIVDGDFADTLASRHYPNVTNSTTPFKFPTDAVSGDCYGSEPYIGKTAKANENFCTENYNLTTNRLGTANFVEYFTNAEINNIGTTNIPNFIDFQANHARPSTTYPAQGIGAFRVTNAAGFVYHYSLPVFSNSSTNFTYPINNDYSLLPYTQTFTVADAKIGTTDNYYVSHVYGTGSLADTAIVEVKTTAKFATEWKLTAITGPDYVDVNNNNVADVGDKGYWMSFDYKLWSNNFISRYPTYGFNYYFGLDEKTANYTITDPLKRSGKFATASLNDAQLYYLNAIQSSTHKALIVRDIRQDEPSADPLYDNGLADLVKVGQSGTTQSSHGYMYDDGGLTNYPSGTGTISKQIQLGSPSKLVLNFKTFALSGSDNVSINTASGALAFTHNSINYTSPFSASNMPPLNQEIIIDNFTSSTLTFNFNKLGGASNQGFNIEWHAIGKKTPQLLVKRILLVDNTAVLPTLTALSNTNTRFDLTGTTNASTPCFNETWYQANKTAIDALTMKGATLEYDYTLANNYYNNINCQAFSSSRLSSPNEVFAILKINTVTGGMGKLTLNKIISTELGNVQTTPSIKLDYNVSSATDNPNYDPRKVDYWGYYKNDVSTLGYTGYVTNTSKDLTDAWFLRKVISPMGGITEMEYESNAYNKVLTGKGGFRGAQRVFSIKDFTPDYSYLNLEEGNTMTSDLAEVFNTSPPSGMTMDFMLPFVNDPTNNHAPTNQVDYYYFTSNLPYNSSTPLPIYFPDLSSLSASGTYYSGNGWLRFKLPVGYTVYGAGCRVKKIISRNNTKDAYTTLYEYENGVALNEADRFANPRQRYLYNSTNATWEPRYEKLQSFGGDKFDLSVGVGYSKVTTKNLGQVNTAQGFSETYFNTSDALTSNTYIDNFKVNQSTRATIASNCTLAPIGYTCNYNNDVKIIEYSDKFSPYWGLTTEDRVYDVNNNMLNKTVYEYETTQQGALVENFLFRVDNSTPVQGGEQYQPCLTCNHQRFYNQVSIKRQYPAVLKRTTSYGMGTKTISQTLKRDELTGAKLVEQTTSDNNSSALIITTPAYRIPTYETMGAKSINPAWDNVLGAEAFHYSVIDSTLMGTAGAPSINFAGASVNVFSKTAAIRNYDIATNNYITNNASIPYWLNKASFAWTGTVSSLDNYGLYKKSELSANPFNHANPYSSNSKWRFGSEISLVDAWGHSLETRGYNNKFSATKMSAHGKYLLAEASNCNYESFTYSGFEFTNTAGANTLYDGEIKLQGGNQLYTPAIGYAVQPHTGANVLKVNPATTGCSYAVSFKGLGTFNEELGLLGDRIYRASVWVHNSSDATSQLVLELSNSGGVLQTVNMTITNPKVVTVDNWKLLSVDLKIPANVFPTSTPNTLTAYVKVTGAGTGWFDDMQLHPVESQAGAKVYDAKTGRITADLDGEGYATKYIYDAAGKVIETYKELPNIGLKLVKRNSYNYARGID